MRGASKNVLLPRTVPKLSHSLFKSQDAYSIACRPSGGNASIYQCIEETLIKLSLSIKMIIELVQNMKGDENAWLHYKSIKVYG